jgi:hypothetical protein
MVKTLGVLDLIITLMLLAIAFKLEVPLGMIIVIPAFLLIKALLFINDIGSAIDICAAIIIILSIFLNIPFMILIIVAGLMGFKAIMSLFATS